MSYQGDERPKYDVKAALAAIQQQKQEAAKLNRQAAAAKQTSIGKTKTNYYDSQAYLTTVLKNTNRVNTAQAENVRRYQQNNINQVINKFEEVTKDKDKYSKSSYDKYALDVKKYLETAVDNVKKLDNSIERGKSATIRYNATIRKLEEKSIEPQLKKAYTYKTSPKDRKEREPAKTEGGYVIKIGDIAFKSFPKDTRSTYQRRVDASKKFVSDLINADIKDEKQAAKLIDEITPKYIQNLGDDAGERFIQAYDRKLRNYEKMADYKTPLGIDELTGENKKQNINKLKARLAHMTLATDKAFIATTGAVALGAAGGPLATGLVAAAGVATFINPTNREELKSYVEEHPQEFLASLGGAALAGVTVTELNKTFKEYTKNMNIVKRKKLEAEYQKIIDDVTYFEQRPGKSAYPSEAIEILDPDPVVIRSDPMDPNEFARQFWLRTSKLQDPKELNAFLKKWQPALLLDLEGDMQSTLITDLVKKYPELNRPWYYDPAFSDPNVINKADITARIKSGNYTPLYAAALAQAAKQGYITEEQIKALIKQNNLQLSELKELGITIPKDIPLTEPITFNDVIEKTDQVPEQIPSTITGQITETPIKPDQIDTPEPTDPDQPPETRPLFLSKRDKELRRKMNFEFYKGSKSLWRVKYSYKGGKGESLTVEAQSLPEAIARAQQAKQTSKTQPRLIDIQKVR